MSDNIQKTPPKKSNILRAILLLVLAFAIFIFGDELSSATQSGEVGYLLCLTVSFLLLIAGTLSFAKGVLLAVIQSIPVPRAIKRIAASSTTKDNVVKVKSLMNATAFGMWLFVLVWSPLTYFIVHAYLTYSWVTAFLGAILAWFFCVIEMLLLWLAILFSIRAYRFGNLVLEIENGGVFVGSHFKATIRPGLDSDPIAETTIQLSCVNKYSIGKGKEAESVSQIKFKEEWKILPENADFSKGIPINFLIPNSAPATNDPLLSGEVNWELSIYVPLRGANYDAVFNITVEKKSSKR